MPGGTLDIGVGSDWSLTMLGRPRKWRTASSLRIFSRVRDARHANVGARRASTVK